MTLPLKGARIVACLHVTVGDCQPDHCSSCWRRRGGGHGLQSALHTDDVAAALAARGLHVYAFRGENEREYYDCIKKALEIKPNVTLDDGADTIAIVHKEHPNLAGQMLGGCEETTTGVVRLRPWPPTGLCATLSLP